MFPPPNISPADALSAASEGIIETAGIWSINGARGRLSSRLLRFSLIFPPSLFIWEYWWFKFIWGLPSDNSYQWFHLAFGTAQHSICHHTVNVSAGISHSTTNYEHDIGFQWAGTLCWVAAPYHKSLHLFISMLGDLRPRPWETWLRSLEQSTTWWKRCLSLDLFYFRDPNISQTWHVNK